MNVLILGASGMLGNTLLRYFADYTDHKVVATIRKSRLSKLPSSAKYRLITGIDVNNSDELLSVFDNKFDVVINCVGVIKQLGDSKDVLKTLPLNSLFPHRLAQICRANGARLIHISTDCVFDGKRGYYTEKDDADAKDLYGISKYLGEVTDREDVLTIRTSIIGHEVNSSNSLIDWFLSQKDEVNGYTKAIYSGLPTIELAEVIDKYILPNRSLWGLYQISTNPIDKYSLLKIVADIYDKDIKINPYDGFILDRSLNSEKFKQETGYIAPQWQELIKKMHKFM